MKILYAWDAIKSESSITIYIPLMPIRPKYCITKKNKVFLEINDEYIYLHESKILSDKLKNHKEIIIAEADEGLRKTTLIRHIII